MPNSSRNEPKPRSYIILGSGGHTAEMCVIVQALLLTNTEKDLYLPVKCIVANTDKTSRTKILTTLAANEEILTDEAFVEIPRSREVGQSWVSTVFSTLWALLWSFWMVWRDQPRLVLCNGPGTCVPICLAAYVWRMLGRLSPKSKIVFVESFCRVNTLSLSGRILLHFVDLLVVQWPPLAKRYINKQNVKYFGRIM